MHKIHYQLFTLNTLFTNGYIIEGSRPNLLLEKGDLKLCSLLLFTNLQKEL